MIKYFIPISTVDFFSIEKDFIKQQNDKVLISSMTQIDSHEFIKKHNTDEVIRSIQIKGTVLILRKFKLQI